MRFVVACSTVIALSFVSRSLATATGSPLDVEFQPAVEPPTTALPLAPPELLKRASKTTKRHKHTRRPRPHPKRPHHHPTTGCTTTELVKNGDFNKNVKSWDFLGGSDTQFFWIKSSKKRPSHSGAGQAYLFLPRGYTTPWLSTTIPAIEYGNTYTVSAWLRYKAPNDLIFTWTISAPKHAFRGNQTVLDRSCLELATPLSTQDLNVLTVSRPGTLSPTTAPGMIALCSTSTFFYDFDISTITTKWTKFEANNIETSTYDYLYIGIYQCASDPQPVIYLDHIYFGKDPSSPPAPMTSSPPEPTPTLGPCTTTLSLIDPSFELPNLDTWLFHDQSPNADTTFSLNSASTYGPPTPAPPPSCSQSSASATAPTPAARGSTSLMATTPPCACSATASSPARRSRRPRRACGRRWRLCFWCRMLRRRFRTCMFRLIVGIRGGWLCWLMMLRLGRPPVCSVVPTISDGGFESGDVKIWDVGFGEGDETFTITTAKAHTGKRSGVLTFPSASNSAGFSREFDACVGGKYTFHMWSYMPKAYKSSPCSVNAYAWYTGDSYIEDVAVWDTWVEYKLDFVAGATVGHMNFGVSCLNRLGKVVVFLHDVGITVR
ncbi:uncharacterized protein BDZ99DRAFT_538599 [Mytilinidion resinicola]|uniref:Concanavalin A-like lectin/glucanase n=1 Tax=Mytilinidion resinicola TaxID=574789 RepID=A0A6A6YC54_9PEZI|nr:uncharacterized protein BDZ99DRAFT_538599 [Mytilinidion resinicola]KAF2806382.1 hypothetical protein BDZ99DRAFT_538599 [Mytilinidion resinicola]